MNRKLIKFILFTIIITSVVRCAKKGMPEGGPIDEEPPRFIRANPENYTTNFKAEEIRILFNEYIKLENPQQQIIISPPMDPKPNILPLGQARKDVRIEIGDTLRENTTYAINFGKSIVDNNEGNPYPYFKYVFSTGDYIDSLEVSGFIEDAYLKETPEFVSIFLYEMDSTYTDSVVYKDIPRYVSYTRDSSVNFDLENLKAGKYQMVAILDDNDNYKFNPGKDKIGFLEHPITIPTDSVYTLSIFQEELAFEVKRPKLFKGRQLLIGYQGMPNLDDLELNFLYPPMDAPVSRITRDAKTDTLYYWFRDPIETDSVSLEVVTPRQRDTVYIRMAQLERDSLNVSPEPSGNIEYKQPFLLKANTPLVEKNDALITILNKDSIEVPFTSEIRYLENQLEINFEKEPEDTYYFKALPGTLTDLFGDQNDTINQKLTTKPLSDYGSLIMSLRNVRSYPIIIELTTLKGELVKKQTLTEGTNFTFEHLNAGDYFLRIIYDKNENGYWDTGSWLERRKPEKISYYPDTLSVRASWDKVIPPFYLD
ncbi:Ig-like domain-containing protein [Zunongwangia sp. HRR-M8]|uniref:Ig-like domain-containing protein n=1 Tax=Zunongwangia sp. HRR-M8 TaxID=3015170 RepID=UPI0022DDFEF2|nr:Ig-like domain-containing protein [Zunongwangia sp. HRR-M8]WBL22111.1 Ig-like domain-containing protein [Zunongwangia sp. HRR-M8]